MFKIPIKTTKNVQLFFTPASLGYRVLARLIDVIIQTGYVYFLIEFEFLELVDNSKLDYWGKLAIISLLVLPIFLYPIVSEMFMSGQTFGKQILKIRVVKIDGYQPSFTDYIIRGMLALLEIYFILPLSIISIIITKKSQRIGDILSGTAVVSERKNMNLSHTILVESEQVYKPYFSHSEILLFSDKDVNLIKKYFLEAQKMKKYEVLEKISEKITKISQKQKNKLTCQEFIELFLRDYSFHISKN